MTSINSIRFDAGVAYQMAEHARKYAEETARKLVHILNELDEYDEYLGLLEQQNCELRLENEALISELDSQERRFEVAYG